MRLKKKILAGTAAVITAVVSSSASFAVSDAREITSFDPGVSSPAVLTKIRDTRAFAVTEIDSDISIPELKVTIPGNAGFITNPYNLTITVDGQDLYGQVISPDFTICNYSKCKVYVEAIAVGVPSNSSITLSRNGYVDWYSTKKQMALYLEDDWGFNQIMVTANTPTKYSEMFTLDSVGSDYYGNDKPAEGIFRIQGECNVNDDVTWSETDTVDVCITYRITRKPNEIW